MLRRSQSVLHHDHLHRRARLRQIRRRRTRVHNLVVVGTCFRYLHGKAIDTDSTRGARLRRGDGDIVLLSCGVVLAED